MLYRSQLSSSKIPIQFPSLPQIQYQQICRQKVVHNSGHVERSETEVEQLMQNLFHEQNIQKNKRKVIGLPPIKHTRKSNNLPYRTDVKGNIKWNSLCTCMRCKLIKSDYEVGSKEHYGQWGKYPCIPDSVINREEQDSSDDEADND